MLNICRARARICTLSTVATAWRLVWSNHSNFLQKRFADFNAAEKGSVLAELKRLAKFSDNSDTENDAAFLHQVVRDLRETPPTQEFLLTLLNQSIASHKRLPNVLSVNRARDATTGLFTTNLTVVGCTHGRYKDFAKIFENDKIGGYPSETNHFIFNGDMVNRGSNALEIVTVLLLAKLLYPNAVHILRGHHESGFMAKHWGFNDEIQGKYDKNCGRNLNNGVYRDKEFCTKHFPVIDKFTELFDTLPIAAVVENKAFVVSGGIGQNVNMKIADINRLNRFYDAKNYDTVGEFLWSAPRKNPGTDSGTRPPFGPDVTKAFLSRNGLQLLIRSHRVRAEGYDVMHDGRAVTVFSAPNYGVKPSVPHNKAAVMRFDQPDSEPAMVKFNEHDAKTPHFERHDCKQAGIQWRGLRRTKKEYDVGRIRHIIDRSEAFED